MSSKGQRFTRRQMLTLIPSLGAVGLGTGLAVYRWSSSPVRRVNAAGQETALMRAKRLGYITAAYTNAAPFGFSDRPGNVTGADIETLKVILPKIGIKEAQFAIVPFGTLIPGLQAERFDLVALSMGILPARCEQVEFTEPTNCIGSGFAVKRGNPLNLHGYEDVAKNPRARLAVVTGGAELGTARAAGVPDGRISSFEGQPQALAALKGDRVDAFALTAMGVIGMLKAANDSTVENALPFRDQVINGKKSELCGAFAVRKDDKDLRDAINGVLREMKADGSLKQIYTKFDFLPSMIPGSEPEHNKDSLCKG